MKALERHPLLLPPAVFLSPEPNAVDGGRRSNDEILSSAFGRRKLSHET